MHKFAKTSSNRLILILCLLLVVSSLLPMLVLAEGNPAEEEKSAVEKLEELKLLGIFTGYDDSLASVKEWKRSDVAIVVARLLGQIEQLADQHQSTSSSFTDLDGVEEWAHGSIDAVAKAGIMEGRGNGIFAPNENLTYQELAVIMVKFLGLEVDPNAEVDNADDWAKPYLDAAIRNGLILEQTDYTSPITSEILVDATFEMKEQIEISNTCAQEPRLAISSSKLDLSGASRTMTLVFNTAIDPGSIQPGGILVNGAPVWPTEDQSGTEGTEGLFEVSEDGLTLTVTLPEDYEYPEHEPGKPVFYQWTENGQQKMINVNMDEPSMVILGVESACGTPIQPSAVSTEVAKPVKQPAGTGSSSGGSSNPSGGGEGSSSTPRIWKVSEGEETVTGVTYFVYTFKFENVTDIAYIVAPQGSDPAPTKLELHQAQIETYTHQEMGDCEEVIGLSEYRILISKDFAIKNLTLYVVGIKDINRTGWVGNNIKYSDTEVYDLSLP